VNAELIINQQGEVVASHIRKSTDPLFDAATREAVRILRFEPAQIMGSTVNACVELPIQWRTG
jgi:TonB family protein